jgi:hypothetical protein
MGQGKEFSADASNPASCSSWLGIGTIRGAIQKITGSKWAKDAVRDRRSSTRTRNKAPLQYRGDSIPWEEVEGHASAESCWIVVKSKVCSQECALADHVLLDYRLQSRFEHTGVRRHSLCTRSPWRRRDSFVRRQGCNRCVCSVPCRCYMVSAAAVLHRRSTGAFLAPTPYPKEENATPTVILYAHLLTGVIRGNRRPILSNTVQQATAGHGLKPRNFLFRSSSFGLHLVIPEYS